MRPIFELLLALIIDAPLSRSEKWRVAHLLYSLRRQRAQLLAASRTKTVIMSLTTG